MKGVDMKKSNGTKKGFTIVELLTVMGVIALLIGLLVPALNIVKKIAKDTKQRAQFHSIEVALEIFRNDESDFPDSTPIDATGGIVTGSQRMTEALVGRDLQGFDPVSKWHPAMDTTAVTDAYSTDDTGAAPTKKELSIQRRKGPYLRLENVGAFRASDLYKDTVGIGGVYDDAIKQSPLMTDVYTERQVTLSNGKVVKAGTPILYFRANPSNKDLRTTTGRTYDATDGYKACTYNFKDNEELIALGRVMRQTDPHPINDNTTQHKKFYDLITNPQIGSNTEGVAYNSDSFILMSAGKDGFFGTSDDIYNFGD